MDSKTPNIPDSVEEFLAGLKAGKGSAPQGAATRFEIPAAQAEAEFAATARALYDKLIEVVRAFVAQEVASFNNGDEEGPIGAHRIQGVMAAVSEVLFGLLKSYIASLGGPNISEDERAKEGAKIVAGVVGGLIPAAREGMQRAADRWKADQNQEGR